MNYTKPLTPKLRRQIDESIERQMMELSECQNTSYVSALRTGLNVAKTRVFVQDFFIPEDDGEYWDSMLKRSQELESKYSGDFFQSMILAFIDYAERKVKE